MELYYKGVDIYDQISVCKCMYESYAESKSDLLKVVFNDVDDEWDSWKPQKGDTIRVVLGLFDSGDMNVTDVKPSNGQMTIYASSTPTSKNNKSNKSWSNVHFKQLCQEIADRHNLACVFYGIEDYIYDYVNQENKEDFKFLAERCVIEGCAFLVFNGKLIVYNESYIESQATNYNLEIPNTVPFDYRDSSDQAYGTCVIKNGSLTGTYESGSSDKTLNKIVKMRIASQAEANRFAKNMLRFENKKMASGVCESGVFLPGYAAGSIVNLQTSGVNSWDCKVFFTYVLHDLVKAKTTFRFRKTLEGY